MSVSTPAAMDRLVLISPHPDGVQNEFEAAFKSHYSRLTGREIALEWLDVGGGTSSILRYIKSEFSRAPGGIGIDIFFGGGIDPFMEIADMGLCSPLEKQSLEIQATPTSESSPESSCWPCPPGRERRQQQQSLSQLYSSSFLETGAEDVGLLIFPDPYSGTI